MTEPTHEIEVQRAVLGKHNHQGYAVVGRTCGVMHDSKLIALWRGVDDPTWKTIAIGATLFELLEKVRAYDARKRQTKPGPAAG
jgi:hypothetical protein